MKKYRVVKTHWRDQSYGKIRERYLIEELVPKGWLIPEHWRELQELNCGMSGDCFKQTVYFDTQEKACEYVEFLTTPTPRDEVVSCEL